MHPTVTGRKILKKKKKQPKTLAPKRDRLGFANDFTNPRFPPIPTRILAGMRPLHLIFCSWDKHVLAICTRPASTEEGCQECEALALHAGLARGHGNH